MNRLTALGRKLIYLVVLIAMLVPLYLLGQPAAGSGDSGGQLSQMRRDFNIAESDLGEISPASESMKLASLGLRGVAATLLWNKAHEYRVAHEWDRLKATLNNIALLQPHFDRVWEHQAHNLAYNVSIEFDDYRQRYEMVREGTEFLTRGVRQNKRAPRLIWYTGWFYGSKLGMSDEKTQFRRLFSQDDVLHNALLDEQIDVDSPEALGPLSKPDNWLVGRLWLKKGYELVDSGITLRRQTAINFYETGPKWRFKHAEAIEDEGVLDERAISAWKFAQEDWSDFGNRSLPTTSAFTIKLDQSRELVRQKEERLDQFKELTSPTYEAETQKRVDMLTEEARKILESSPADLEPAERDMQIAVQNATAPTLETVVQAVDPSVRLRALDLMKEIQTIDVRKAKTELYRDQVNYPYWKALAQAEQEERTVEARRLSYDAEKANDQAMLDDAIRLYEKSFENWAEIFDDYPILTVDESAQELIDSIRRYMIAIDSENLPEEFPLMSFLQMMDETGQVRPEVFQLIKQDLEKSVQRRLDELVEEDIRQERAAQEAEARQGQ